MRRKSDAASPRVTATVGEFRALWARDPDAAAAVLQVIVARFAQGACARLGLGRDRNEDVAADAVVRVIQNDRAVLRAARADARVGAWARRVVQFVALERLTGRCRRRTAEGQVAEFLPHPGRIHPEAGPDGSPEQDSGGSLIARALALHHEGLSVCETVQRLGADEEASIERLSREVDCQRASGALRPSRRRRLPRVSADWIAGLPDDHQAAWRLAQRGMSDEVIGHWTGHSAEAVNSLLRRLRRVATERGR